MQDPPPASDGWRKSPAKKDTKHWCKGKVGREHQPEAVLTQWGYSLKSCGMLWDIRPWAKEHHDQRPNKWNENRWVCAHDIKCSVCGKILKNHYSMTREECPVK